MNPLEIAWLEDQHRLETRLGSLKQEEEAWRAHHARAAQELEAASASVRVQQAAVDEHLKAKPEPEAEE